MFVIEYVESIQQLTNSEKYLVDFINTDPHFFIANNIGDISKQANVSNSTVTRLYKKLGFKSLKSFQIAVSNKLASLKQTTEVLNDKAIEAVINNLKVFHTHSIKETLNGLDLTKISALIHKIITSKKIQLFGIGSSWNACNELGSNLEKIGFDIMMNNDFHMQLLNLTKLTDDDLVIVFSKSLNAKELNFLIKKCLDLKVPLCVMTSNKKYPLKDKINYFISFAVFEQKNRITAISSKISQLILADLIFTEIFNRLENIANNLIKIGNKIIEEWNKD
ncbi:MurR/RpiR family transcriptional regulator [Spiroplasma clarkii]|nr:MurR/RpiR family transcriptional regulator [Spiroplasma clarkii]